MNFKTTYILFGVLAAILVVFFVVLWMNPLPPEGLDEYVFPSLHDPARTVTPNDVTEITIERKDDKPWVFVKEELGDRWVINEPRKMRADSTSITGMLNQIFEARRDPHSEKLRDRKEYGLATPAETITLTLKDGKKVKLEVGDTTAGEQSAVTYVVSSDHPKEVLAVPKNRLDDLARGLNAYRARNPLTASEGDIEEITLSEEGKPTLELVKHDTRWDYVKPFKGETDREGDSGTTTAGSAPSGVQALLHDLTNIRSDYRSDKDNDFVADDVKPADLGNYNLGDKNKVLKVQLKVVEQIERTRDKENKEEKKVKTSTVTLLIGIDKEVEDKEDKTRKFYYAKRADENDIIRVPVKNVQPLLKLLEQPDALRDRHLVRVEAGKEIDALTIKNPSGTLEFRKPGKDKPWQLWQGDKEQKIDDNMVKGLVTLLTERRKDISFDVKGTDSELGLDRPAVDVSIWIDGMVKEEKKDDKKDDKVDKKEDKKEDKKDSKPAKPQLKVPEKPAYRLLFAAPKDLKPKDVVVKRTLAGEEPTLLRVPVVVYERVLEGPLAYLDKSLPRFSNDFDPTRNVTKLMYELGGKTTEVTREKAGEAPWKIVKPADLAGREADPTVIEMILQRLNEMRAGKLVAEKPSADDLDKKYGLKTPAARALVTVTQDGKTETHQYDFGKEEGNELFAKQNQRDVVFTVDKGVLFPFKEELLTRKVFSFDVNKVKSVKLTGWKKLLGSPFIIEAEKDGMSWKVKTPKDFKIDDRKLNDFLRTLSNLQAEKFVAHGVKELKADQELQVDQGALRIEVTVEGEKQPFVLTLGKQDGESYLATSDKVPGDIFTVPRDRFKDAVDRPAYFSP